MTKKDSQVVVRIDSASEKKMKRAADKQGLTKAAWVRQLILRALIKVN